MSIGDGIAIAGVCVVLVSAILKFVPRKNNKNSKDNPGENKKFVEEKLCDDRHAHIDARLKEIGEDVKDILKRI